MPKFIIIITLSIVFFGCTLNSGTDEKPTVSVSIIPEKYFVDIISDNMLNVNVMIPPGAGHSTYEPLPSQMKDLNKSKIYFKIGHLDFEFTWIERFKNSNKSMKIVDLSENFDLSVVAATSCCNHAHETEHNANKHAVDPHLWLNPIMVKSMIEKIAEEIAVLLPSERDSILIRKNSFIDEIDLLNRHITEKLERFKGNKFLIFHPALTWFAYQYGLEQIAVEIDGKEPSPSEIRKIIQTVKDENIKAILIQNEFPFERAIPISKETGIDIIQINPLAYNWVENMYEITSILEKAMSK